MLKKTFEIIISLCPLILGGVIYIAFRSQNLKMFTWFNNIGLHQLISVIRISTITRLNFPKWFVYNLPDGLWICSAILINAVIWNFKINTRNIIWYSLIPLIAILSEFFQRFDLISGTYDFLDLIFYMFFAIISIILIKIKSTYYEKN